MKTSLLALLVACLLTTTATASTDTPDWRAGRDAPVSYLYKARVLRMLYELEWVEAGGDRYGDCTAWSDDRGATSLVARSAAVRRGQPETLAGSISMHPGRAIERDERTGRWQWAEGAAVGGLKVLMVREFTHTGGVTACGDEPARSDPPPASDCGNRNYKLAGASMTPDLVVGNYYLDELQTTMVAPVKDWFRIFRISGTPQSRAPLYRRCKTTLAAPAFLAALPVVVRNDDATALLKLQPGESYLLRYSRTGPCQRDIPPTETCRYTIGAKIEIERWRPGTRFP